MTDLLFSAVPLDHAHHLRRDEAALAALAAGPQALVLPYWRDQSLVAAAAAIMAEGGDAARLLDVAGQTVFLGLWGGRAVFAADLTDLPAEPDGGAPHLGLGGEWKELRGAGPALDPDHGALLATGRALVNWHRSARFCGRCGAPTRSDEGGHVRTCQDGGCGVQHYPRMDPAVIMCVTDGDRILLHRQPAWPAGMWSVLAGFVEPGEPLEHAVQREVAEETGIQVADIVYVASQPWPFPSSLMIGYRARAVGGTLRPDPHELEDAAWFSRADIAAQFDDANRGGGNHAAEGGRYLARPGSIARLMIDAWLAEG